MEKRYQQDPTDLIKVVLFGPESTGKTTLSRQLAKHYNSVWVPEYAREYLQNKWNDERKTCEPKDLLPIAEGQIRLENSLAKKASEVLICDTDLLETKVYSEAYYLGYCDPVLEKHALENTYDIYFLTDIDIPWEKDDLRDKPNDRAQMFLLFKETLEKYSRNFIILSGDKKTRLAKAVSHINQLLSRMKFSKDDQLQLKNKGISESKVLDQIATFKEGIPFVKLEKAAVVGNGISKFSPSEEENYLHQFELAIGNLSLLKFVPASGAASRMFKAMFNFLDAYDPKNETFDAYLERTNDKDAKRFFEGYENFGFYTLIQDRIKGKAATPDEEKHLFVKEMLLSEGLNFGFYPKGLLPFHKYDNHTETPFEEHLKEADAYANVNNTAKLHFTISEQHAEMFKEEFKTAGDRVSANTGTTFSVSYSFQKPSTDTIAVNMDNSPFRNPDGSLLFRPAGHGALIENLNDQDADIIFIKNIDNVVVPRFLKEVEKSKKILAGFLMELQSKAFKYAETLDKGQLTEDTLSKIKSFLEKELNVRFPENYKELDLSAQTQLLKEKINKPIRVCGMVKNEGEPGGGPFWVKDQENQISLQIIESAQVDANNPQQLDIMKNATHFNPVDLVCGVRNYKGEKYNLLDFVDSKQGFITQKTQEGKELQAMELPGLWNGAMAFWNTIFVEVPLITFNPVKTVNDLLKPAHQVQ
ncbi:DUF4301 family protein [Arenibacter sp. 6A1]|uniref:DUF4301 family protein n=1 Tax=Arenibacter sp. 6A1 TaxID=2720391 RepID=UPI0014452FBD|nr:DUF4301 family protein [Arenibacter sp. 6A1]NKI26198.1 DUF4301 family protein [Arenibacter sp. 6A1]